MSKILLFTHKVDIDGMGSVVLSNLAFKEVDVIFCETFEVDKLFNEKLKTGKLYNYDYIFITDICLSENLIKEVSLNTKLL